MFKIDIDTTPQKQLAAKLHKGAYTNIGTCFEELATLATRENLWPGVRGMIGIYHDDPNVVDVADLQSHAALWMTEGAAIPDTLEALSLPASDCAILHYKGPYHAIKVAYDYLYGAWLPKSGREPADAPPYEIYLNSASDTPESELLTDIILPLSS